MVTSDDIRRCSLTLGTFLSNFSLFLFGLCLEVFSRSLKVTSMQPNFNFHLMCARVGITHLAYADDLLFARANDSSITLIANYIAKFGSTSGLESNLSKSSMYLVGIHERMRDRLLEITRFQLGSFLFRYLGIPLAAEKLRQITIVP